MKLEFDKSEISVSALLGCFSIPSNAEYLMTEIGIAMNFYQNFAVDKSLVNPYQLQAHDNNRTHTIFSMFTNANQRQFIKNHIPSAMLEVKNTKEFTKGWELICEFICSQFNNVPITLNIKFNIAKNDFDIVSVSAESKLLTKNDLLSIPLILMLIQP
ncbi:hypothetical protein [Polynucleobacter sp. AP-Sving-400A-A2]|uniref:hypothetical protein n=1 Tax=Polynucleobacter sp. AP-Sving-400A-A2 TaxID=2081049 RepID=UPI001BFD96BA|nr:hypothetical protein [Polynucleobacter sp. AP-Sving-400A-A2]QWE14362.1 hypothetical protein C2758_09400 [Polynucleobacter sp. AP-Sving-400A-A2]